VPKKRTKEKRREYFVDLTDASRDRIHMPREEKFDGSGNLFSSEVPGKNGTHAPTLDIDGIEVELLESTTKGNYHLYIEKEMDWPTYRNLLLALEAAGILQSGFVGLSIARGATFLRKPGIAKKPEDVYDS
jgi:hypothetical protein